MLRQKGARIRASSHPTSGLFIVLHTDKYLGPRLDRVERLM
jgi:hypothetical protein